MTPTRKQSIRLIEDEQYAIYKYCIEQRCIHQIEAAIEFRVNATLVANEINQNYPKITNGKVISSYHVKSAIEAVVGWQKRLGKLPVVPLETVELDQLKIEKTKYLKEIEQLKHDNVVKSRDIQVMNAEIERLKQSGAQVIVDRIRQLVNGASPTAPKSG